MLEKAHAILIRRTLLAETSLIVQWCSLEHGLIKTVARGARRPGSPFAGKLDLFYGVEIEFKKAGKGDLHTLREAAILTYRQGLQVSYLRVLAAAYFTSLIESVAENDSLIESLFYLLQRALDWLTSHEPTLKAVLFFERELAQELGIHGEANVAPIIAIGHVIHKMPPQRAEIMRRLDAGTA